MLGHNIGLHLCGAAADGRAKVTEVGALPESTAHGVGIANVMRFADVDLQTAINMASTWPAEILGLTPVQLAPGATADLVLFQLPDNEPLQVIATLQAGQLVYGSVD